MEGRRNITRIVCWRDTCHARIRFVYMGSCRQSSADRGFSLVPATATYFSIYEFTKRNLTANHVPEVVSHLTAGALGDLIASIFYVPSEVLKTRLQLQGRYNNPHFISGYNYKGTWHATRTVIYWKVIYGHPRLTVIL